MPIWSAIGNEINLRSLICVLLDVIFGHNFVIEQPRGSVFFKLPGWFAFWNAVNFYYCSRCTMTKCLTYLGAYGGESQKPVQLISNKACVLDFFTRARPDSSGRTLTTISKGGWYCGNKWMSGSENYPPEFSSVWLEMLRALFSDSGPTPLSP